MGDGSKIEWTDASWNPAVGCSVTSPGCKRCYAMKMAARLEAMGQPIYRGLTQQTKEGAVWTGKVEMSNWGQVIKPLSWKRPRRIFVNSMSDLFHERLSFDEIDLVFAIMSQTTWHTYQVLTKRSERMREYITGARIHQITAKARELFETKVSKTHGLANWPLSHLWLGVSVEDRDRRDRIDHLRETPAAVRFLSVEPLLEDLGTINLAGIHQVIVGGESGPRAREFYLSWAERIVDQCASAGVACFVKQIGANAYDDLSFVGATPRYPTRDRKGGDPQEWPESLRVREFPR